MVESSVSHAGALLKPMGKGREKGSGNTTMALLPKSRDSQSKACAHSTSSLHATAT